MNDSGQATRSPAHEANYLRAARETGVLSEEQLRLAAYAHHPPALEVVGPQYRVKPKSPSEELAYDELSGRWLESQTGTTPSPGEVLIGWANGLGTWGLEAELRAGLAYAYLILRSLERHLDRPTGDLIAFPWMFETLEALVRVNGARLDAVAAWVQNPAPATRRRVDLALNLPDPKRLGFLSVDDEQGIALDLCGWCDQLGRVGEELAFAVGKGRVAFERWWSAACTTDEAVLHRVQSVFGKALIPWALGYGDPLRARQSARLARTRPALTCEAAPHHDASPAERHATCACGQIVYDIRELTPGEAEQVLRAYPEGRLAVRLYRRADGRLQVNDCDPALEQLANRTTELDSASSLAA